MCIYSVWVTLLTQPETVREIGIEYFAIKFIFFNHNLVQVSSSAIHY